MYAYGVEVQVCCCSCQFVVITGWTGLVIHWCRWTENAFSLWPWPANCVLSCLQRKKFWRCVSPRHLFLFFVCGGWISPISFSDMQSTISILYISLSLSPASSCSFFSLLFISLLFIFVLLPLRFLVLVLVLVELLILFLTSPSPSCSRSSSTTTSLFLLPFSLSPPLLSLSLLTALTVCAIPALQASPHLGSAFAA